MVRISLLISAFALGTSLGCAKAAATSAAATEKDMVVRGRYIAVVAGCNDCHTPNYIPAEGNVPESQWLIGDTIGYRGPWGTTYAINLRLLAHGMDEDQWVKQLKSAKARPPMPYYALWQMDEADLRALHRYIRSLGPSGEAAPAYVPPGQEPLTPYFEFVPKQPERSVAKNDVPPANGIN